jgi:hypothetical protein
MSDAPVDADDPTAWRDPEETARLRDEAFRRLMKMPPKPQEEMKLGKSSRKQPPDKPAGRENSERA